LVQIPHSRQPFEPPIVPNRLTPAASRARAPRDVAAQAFELLALTQWMMRSTGASNAGAPRTEYAAGFAACLTDGSGVSREVHAPFRERLEVQSLRPARAGMNPAASLPV